MEWYWKPERCRLIMRILGAAGTVLALAQIF